MYMYAVVGGRVGNVAHVCYQHRINFDAFPSKHLETLPLIPIQASDFLPAHPPRGIRWMVSECLTLHHQCLDQKAPKEDRWHLKERGILLLL